MTPATPWDASGHEQLAVALRNHSTGPLAVHGVLEDPWIDGLVILPAGGSGMLEIPLRRPNSGDGREQRFPMMHGRPGGFQRLWTGVDRARIRNLTLTVIDPPPSAVLEIGDVQGRSPHRLDPEPALPMVDRFGQYRWTTWPGKLRDANELARRHAAEARQLDGLKPLPDRSRYGGWATGPRLKATGHFRAERHHGRWWLVDPEGYLFWSHGITCVSSNNWTKVADRMHLFEQVENDPGLRAALGGGWSHLNANLYRSFGAQWRTASDDLNLRRLPAWGFNTIGNWSAETVCKAGRLPYVLPIHYECPQIGSKFPDVADPAFTLALRRAIAAVAWSAEDPWCIGYFIDNELVWPKNNRAALAEAYYSACAAAMRELAPRKLYLGSRLCEHHLPYGGHEEVVRAAARHCDVISINRYRFHVDDLMLPGDLDRPVLISEFHFGALDRGLLHAGLRSVASQEQRGLAYGLFLRSSLRHPQVVGTHWFQFADQPVTGRFDGENYQVGFVDVTDTPYPETIAAARAIGEAMYPLRAGLRTE